MNRIVNASDFKPHWIIDIPEQKRKGGNPGTRSQLRYKDIVTAFDIETTYIPEIEQSVMYIWQWQFGEKYTIIGRTWEEFIEFRNKLVRAVQYYNDKCKLVVYVHNLSYEFQFLRGIYPFTPEEVFCVDSRQVLRANMCDCLEFRCSMLHSNMSLKQYTHKMGAKHEKLDGEEFDYSKKRYSWTPMTDRELEYCINDVLGLVESIQIEMKLDNDNLYTIPLTSTGYVRRDAKKALKKVNHNLIPYMLPDYTIYCMLRKAFRGGNTHANRYYADKTLTNVKSWDRSSSYPDVILNCEFPMTPFTHVSPEECSLEYAVDLMTRRRKALLLTIAVKNIRLKDIYYGCPYLSISKCEKLIDNDNDNGRIMSAKYLETTITDIDFKIIMDQYEGEFFILDLAYAKYGPLPQPFKDLVISYYVNKTKLKNVSGQEVYYEKSKNLLNALYGMCAQDPVKQLVQFSSEKGFFVNEQDEEEILLKHNQKAFLPYQWGVWVTAWARQRLQLGIDLVGDGFVYCDTDSVKYVGNVDWTELNNQLQESSEESGAHATDKNGVEHYMGVYEEEHTYDKFRTLGAKKYVTQIDDELTTTIAGVVKKSGGEELKENGGIESFKEGFVFVKAGGNELVYNDEPYGNYTIDGNTIFVSSNVVIKPSTYRLGLTHEYYELLEYCKSLQGEKMI